ncbi:MAG: hypothetical protein E6R03_11665 [Hyphomicrobiaceae bacterium]|nr:MAG: hypothetical protein E6R03_11665 [Hyphomicrobiaceae bacterium]
MTTIEQTSTNPDADVLFRLKRPCNNCPFLKAGAIELAPGRIEGIIQALMSDDLEAFPCHKTTHGGDFEYDPETGEEVRYVPDGRESYCVGAMAYLLKKRSPNVAMRLGAAFGKLSYAKLTRLFDRIID